MCVDTHKSAEESADLSSFLNKELVQVKKKKVEARDKECGSKTKKKGKEAIEGLQEEKKRLNVKEWLDKG